MAPGLPHSRAFGQQQSASWFELSAYSPTALHDPAAGHDTELTVTNGRAKAPAGGSASTAGCQIPAVSVTSNPS